MESVNYFELFGLPEQFSLDEKKLRDNYNALMQQYHPDKAAVKTDFEKKQILALAAAVNDGYRVLSSPLERAAFILRRLGVDVDSQTDTRFPIGFLQQQMQWHEDLETGIETHDANLLQSLSAKISHAKNEILQLISHIFDQSLSAEQIEQAYLLVRQGRFLDKLLIRVDSEHEKLKA